MKNLVVKRIPKTKNIYRFLLPHLDEKARAVMEEAAILIYWEEYEQAIPPLKTMLKEYPEALKGWAELGSCFQELDMHTEALAHFVTAYHFGMEALLAGTKTEDFQLPWDVVENRNFYLVCKELAREYLIWNMNEEAYALLSFVMQLDEKDPEQVLELVLQYFLAVGDYQKVLDFFEMYPGTNTDPLANIIHVILAYIGLGQSSGLKENISDKWFYIKPYFEELLKTEHIKPKTILANRENLNFRLNRNAYYYAIECKKYWLKVPGAMDFVKEMVL